MIFWPHNPCRISPVIRKSQIARIDERCADSLSCSYVAKPTGHGLALPNDMGEAPVNLVFGGGDASIAEMVKSTGRGILVTRLWYIRDVDPYEKVLTGMTRDGTFLVRDGRITGGVRNFRFNQSVLEMLANVEMMGPAVRAAGEESFEMVVPAMKVNNFNFSEVTKF